MKAVYEVPVIIKANTYFKVLAESEENALEIANDMLDGSIYESADGGITVVDGIGTDIDSVEVDKEGIVKTSDDPKEHPDYDESTEEE